MLLDEPFGALDALTRLSMHRLLLNLWEQHGFGVLLVTHDVDEAISLADTVLVLDEGRLAHTLRIRNPRKPRGSMTPKPRTTEESSLHSWVFKSIVSATAIVLSLTACTSGRDDKGDAAAPALVPLSGLSNLTLRVGDQKGGTESLLRAAGSWTTCPTRSNSPPLLSVLHRSRR